jgi:hypothetical protein
MSDQLTHSAPLPSAESVRHQWVVPAVQAVVIVVVSAALGVLGGWLWQRWWTPGEGIVWQGQWNKGLLFLDQKTFAQRWSENAHQDLFSAVAIYLLIALVAGAIVGLLAAFFLARREIVTLAAVIIGGVVGGTLMGAVGMALGPADPNALAPHTANGVLLPDQLQLKGATWHLDLFGRHLAPNLLYLAFPGAALLVLVIVFLAYDRSHGTKPAETES